MRRMSLGQTMVLTLRGNEAELVLQPWQRRVSIHTKRSIFTNIFQFFRIKKTKKEKDEKNEEAHHAQTTLSKASLHED